MAGRGDANTAIHFATLLPCLERSEQKKSPPGGESRRSPDGRSFMPVD
jgi:hypothetical protein